MSSDRGRLRLQIIVNVPRTSNIQDTKAHVDKALHEAWKEDTIDVASLACTHEDAVKIAARWRTQNGGRVTAVWEGPVPL